MSFGNDVAGVSCGFGNPARALSSFRGYASNNLHYAKTLQLLSGVQRVSEMLNAAVLSRRMQLEALSRFSWSVGGLASLTQMHEDTFCETS